MKVVCINNGEIYGAMYSSVNLTVGKVYKVLGDRVSSTDAHTHMVIYILSMSLFWLEKIRIVKKTTFFI
jgi:hypothetical protein